MQGFTSSPAGHRLGWRWSQPVEEWHWPGKEKGTTFPSYASKQTWVLGLWPWLACHTPSCHDIVSKCLVVHQPLGTLLPRAFQSELPWGSHPPKSHQDNSSPQVEREPLKVAWPHLLSETSKAGAGLGLPESPKESCRVSVRGMNSAPWLVCGVYEVGGSSSRPTIQGKVLWPLPTHWCCLRD